MAMQTGIGFSKIIILVGTGYTCTMLFNNGKLSELLDQLKGDEAECDYADAIAGQVRRLAMEVRQLASARQITVLNGGSSVDVTSLVVPTAALGTLGYGYMWWKGLSFSDLIYVTKTNITNAVSNMKNNLEQVSDAIAAAKRHLTQRIENLDGKVDEQVERSKLIKDEVADVHDNLSQLGCNMDSLKELVAGMDGKIMTLEEKQEFARRGVQYLCNKFDENMILPQDRFKLAGKSFGGYISSGGAIALECVKEVPENCTPGSKNQSRMLTRRNTIKVKMIERSGQ